MHRVGLIIFPGVQVHSLAPISVFEMANLAAGQPFYELTVLSEGEYERGAERLRKANEVAGGELQLVADFRLYATVGWV